MNAVEISKMTIEEIKIAARNIRNMSNEEIKLIARELSIECSKWQARYLMAMETLGKDDEAVKLVWNEYVAYNEAINPFSVKNGQIFMQEQIDRMSAEECEEWNRAND